MTSIEIAACLNTFKTLKVMTNHQAAKELAMCFPLREASILNSLCLFVQTGILIKITRGKYIINPQPIYYKWIESTMVLYRTRNNNYKKR